MKSQISQTFNISFFLIMFFCTPYIFAQTNVKDKTDDLITQNISLYEAIDFFSKKFNKVIVPNDGVLNSLKSRKATIVVPEELDKLDEKTWELVLNTSLKIYGYSIADNGNILRLTTIKDQWTLNLPIQTEKDRLNPLSEKIVIRVIKLKHVRIDNIRALFKYISDITPPITLMDKRTMIVTTHESNIVNFMNLLKFIDAPLKKGNNYIKSYEFKDLSANQVRNHIQAYFNILRARSKSVIDPSKTPFFLPGSSDKTLLVDAVLADHKIVEEFIGFLTHDVSKIEKKLGNSKIYRLKHAVAKDIVPIIEESLGYVNLNVLEGKKVKITKPALEFKVVPYSKFNAIVINYYDADTLKRITDLIALLDVE